MQYPDPVIYRRGVSADSLATSFTKKSSASFQKQSESEALALFHAMAKRVPAYQKFLAELEIDPKSVQTYQDLLNVPFTNKDTYIKKYTLSELSWDGVIDAEMLSTSSGAGGEPHFWPRGNRLEQETALIYELLLKNFFDIDSHRTLVINAYSMGLYVAGTFTLNSCMRIADKGYPLTIITPGINKADVLRIVQQIGHNFEQIVLCAYPPLAKDIIDDGIAAGIDWSQHNMHFISGGESYSEKWRAHLYKSAGVAKDRYLTASVNTYGSADAAILGHETPMSILIRTIASNDKKLCQELFGRNTLPSFHQYYPFWKNISVTDERELCFSANAGIPLMRYNIHDEGGTYTYDQIMKVLKRHGYSADDVLSQLPKRSLQWKLPFVYLYGRSNSAATIYGLNVYPENIKAALEHDDVLPHLSGKFVLSTEYDRAQNQFLALQLELKKDVNLDRKTVLRIKKIIFQTLREMNAEFKMLSDTFPKRSKPKIKLHTYGHQKHFPTQIKQRYLKKN